MTVRALGNALKSILARAGTDNPDGDAAEIIKATLGYSRTDMMIRGDDEAGSDIEKKAIQLAHRRASGEPIQYVIGSWSFMGRDYLVGEGVLIPRDDTEVVTKAALGLITALPSPSVVDLCAGAGIIGITLKKERPEAQVAAVEKSAAAFEYLSRNCALNEADIRLLHADLADCAAQFDDGSLDLIVSNPPYIRSADIDGLQKEVQYEPRMALDGGSDGYDFYRMILRHWTVKLKQGGNIAFEIGEEQFDTIADILQEHGFAAIKGYPDIQGVTRAITAIKVNR